MRGKTCFRIDVILPNDIRRAQVKKGECPISSIFDLRTPYRSKSGLSRLAVEHVDDKKLTKHTVTTQ
jgi:hypothetical protein